MGIVSFKHKGLEDFFYDGSKKGIQPKHEKKLAMLLDALDAAVVVEKDLNSPAFRLHQLKGDMAGHWAIGVSGNWRITFRFENGDAYDVDYLDYH